MLLEDTNAVGSAEVAVLDVLDGAAVDDHARSVASNAGSLDVLNIYTAGVVETLTREKIENVSKEGPGPEELVWR